MSLTTAAYLSIFSGFALLVVRSIMRTVNTDGGARPPVRRDTYWTERFAEIEADPATPEMLSGRERRELAAREMPDDAQRVDMARLIARQDFEEVGRGFVRDIETMLAARLAAGFGFVYLIDAC